ncbi:MAG: hypothetical protein FJ000_05035 [Actinobacteria bacterium]|nr:hypothetical protein [Actinomycetota bacterium]
MGFLKDMKDLSKTGKEMQKERFGTNNPLKIMKQGVAEANAAVQQVQADQTKTQHLMAEGLTGEATVKGLRDTGKIVNYQPEIEFDLEVELDGREPYAVTHRQIVAAAALGGLQPGARVPVRVDAQDRSQLIIA